MGKTGIKVLCYNWMQSSDWSRTSTTVEERGAIPHSGNPHRLSLVRN